MSLLYGAVEVEARRTLQSQPKGSSHLPFPKTHGRHAAAGALRRLLFASVALLSVFAAQTPGAARQAPAGSLIVTAAGARLREQPDAGSAEVARLLLGAVVNTQERTPARSKVGTAEDFWYLVSAPNGARGWVFGGLVTPFDPARREEVYRSLAAERLSRAESNFAELSELVRFLGRAAKEVTRREAHAELELARLTALARSLASFSIENQEQAPYKSWTNEHAPEIVYSEPAGQWYVRGDLFWDFQSKYKDLPALAERAAWQAAETPLPGECEGFLPCNFVVESMTNGKYLQRYPRGAHAEEALAQIAEFLGYVTEDLRGPNPVYEVPPADRAEFRKTAATLRAQIAAAASPKKTPVLTQFDAIVRRFR
jgi:hypothetical protein